MGNSLFCMFFLTERMGLVLFLPAIDLNLGVIPSWGISNEGGVFFFGSPSDVLNDEKAISC